ncbi:MAG: MnmC family methyltransferase [Methanosphaera sp.]|uniref:MnmC family methyltransferase n=1 Tax=Methanosphaera sp. TaxID=2666342 RepID=UPI0025D5FD8D|nr:MnmC family methyltransferase [Methanosphaera sp.]MCI5867683.1 MnmC family methyltransferase [Methanosphaera sp.]MDD6534151.1 MnmC family methyltransferase [Methanosphaera sp.]
MDDQQDSKLEILDRIKTTIHEIFELESLGHKDAREIYADEMAGFFIKTEDGSYTLSSGERGSESETLHSIFGARTEAFEKFAIPSKLREISEEVEVVKILDICSGIGYNASAVLDYLKDSDVRIEIDMVESSIETLASSLFIANICESHGYVKKVIENYLIENGYLQFNKVLSSISPNIDINIHVCDARDYLKNCEDKEYDAVFLDPFSPSKSPELYSVDFFSKLKNYLTPTALILTYTAASPVRSAMINAGLYIGEGPVVKRSGGTIASRSQTLIDTPLSFSDEKVIALSDVGVPFMDPDLSDDYQTIIERRQSIRSKVRGVSMFPSSSKLPRYLGLSADEIEDEHLREKLTGYVTDMGFDGLDDERILKILDVDLELTSREQILALEDNLKEVMEEM